MLLGRGAELEQIGRLVTDAREGHGRALLIVGEPGIGKTSLLAEAVARAAALRDIEVEAVEAEASLPYALIAEFPRAHARAARAREYGFKTRGA
ncbi:MAG: helix-turn-helix transcriptional regulator [Solirubrobacterales bacterium]|jgi:predicted ATP-dependent serine protease|nr:helix-turn-helix transcriptional regulator [Solirubrobacterales bacterium]